MSGCFKGIKPILQLLFQALKLDLVGVVGDDDTKNAIYRHRISRSGVLV
jgi:hypothetical protein